MSIDKIDLSDGKVVILDFYAEWCGPCKMLTPVLEEIASQHEFVELVKVNIEEDMDSAKAYNIRSVPTLIIKSQNAEEILIGAVPAEQIKQAIDKVRP